MPLERAYRRRARARSDGETEERGRPAERRHMQQRPAVGRREHRAHARYGGDGNGAIDRLRPHRGSCRPNGPALPQDANLHTARKQMIVSLMRFTAIDTAFTEPTDAEFSNRELRR